MSTPDARRGRGTNTIDTVRLAVLAALNIADEISPAEKKARTAGQPIIRSGRIY